MQIVYADYLHMPDALAFAREQTGQVAVRNSQFYEGEVEFRGAVERVVVVHGSHRAEKVVMGYTNAGVEVCELRDGKVREARAEERNVSARKRGKRPAAPQPVPPVDDQTCGACGGIHDTLTPCEEVGGGADH